MRSRLARSRGDLFPSVAVNVAAAGPDASPDPVASIAGMGEALASTGASASINPSTMTVKQVIAHVDEHPSERAAVLAAEKLGRARLGLVVALG